MWYEWIEKIYNGILLSHRKNEILPFTTTCMDLESIKFSEVRERNTVWYHSYMKFKKWMYIARQKHTHRYREQTSAYQQEEGRGEW